MEGQSYAILKGSVDEGRIKWWSEVEIEIGAI